MASYQNLSGVAVVGQGVLGCVCHRLVKEKEKKDIIKRQIKTIKLTGSTVLCQSGINPQESQQVAVKMLSEETACFKARVTQPKLATPVWTVKVSVWTLTSSMQRKPHCQHRSVSPAAISAT